MRSVVVAAGRVAARRLKGPHSRVRMSEGCVRALAMPQERRVTSVPLSRGTFGEKVRLLTRAAHTLKKMRCLGERKSSRHCFAAKGD